MAEAAPEPASDSSFGLLAEGLQRQLYQMGWPSLRPIQTQAIRAYLKTESHLLIMADTAGGKTEAAFLPVLSSVHAEPHGSVRALYVGPLKALINDQFGRVEDLCTHLEMPVHRWHGDVGASKKKGLTKEPGGVLLITPESIESLLINRTRHLSQLFGGLRAVIIDEVHAFLDSVRGQHLASLLSRLRRYQHRCEPPFRMIGLSATVGDTAAAQRYLAPDAPETVTVITDESERKEIQFRVHGYLMIRTEDDDQQSDRSDAEGDSDSDESNVDDAKLRAMARIAEDLVEHCRTHSNLVFANAKGDIELYADLANERCRNAGLPETMLVHHGSLAKEVREDTEQTMKSGRGMTTICSSTLEMGIDIGSVWMVCQIGPPWSVASLKQRMGRSGRKEGEPHRLRMYVICNSSADKMDLLSQEPLDLLQTVAICELLLARWVEPPSEVNLDLSTLTHQVISTIAEVGAIDAPGLFDRLCASGAFRGVPSDIFTRTLRELGSNDVLEQGPDGKLILGLEGERLRSHRDFYAAFASRLEFSIVAGDRVLGTYPIDTLPQLGDHIIFAARRWQVVEIDATRDMLYVKPTRHRKRPRFLSGIGETHPRVRQKMMELLSTDDRPVYLDNTSWEAIVRARRVAKVQDLACRRIISISSSRTLWLTWTGTAAQRTLRALLTSLEIESIDREVALECHVPAATLVERLSAARGALAEPLRLAKHVLPNRLSKYDHLLSDDLLNEVIAADRLDCEAAERVIMQSL